MERLKAVVAMLDESFDTRRKRNIAGGILISVPMLFGGLAFTVMMLKGEHNNEQ